jgi:hypothetical protein
VQLALARPGLRVHTGLAATVAEARELCVRAASPAGPRER